MQKNRIEVSGWLAAKPAVRYLPSGTPVASVRLGETYSYTSQGKAEQHTNWHSLSFYGDLANLAAALNKGDHLFVEGSMEQRRKPRLTSRCWSSCPWASACFRCSSRRRRAGGSPSCQSWGSNCNSNAG